MNQENPNDTSPEEDDNDNDTMPDLSKGDNARATVSRAMADKKDVNPKTDLVRQQIGPFKILRKIAEGGMGAVYMAEQDKPVRRRVALKVIKAGKDSEQIIIRFEAERQALAMMNHPNIAKVLDVGTTEDGSPFFAMELVKGVPITEYCDLNKLSIDDRLKLFIPVCKAVQHAHQKGVIHRDLKPSNVLVELGDGEPIPKVIDFGLAKAMEHQSLLTDKTMFTEYGQIVGTLQYMSPEQAEMNHLDVDTRTDIYALGVMLYELLTGSTPLDQETMGQNALLRVLELIREDEPPRPSVRLSQSTEATIGISKQRQIQPAKLQQILQGELDWVIMKALEKDRTRRYDSASDFAQDISRYLNDEAVAARPPSTSYRISKFVHKNKGLVASLATILLILLAGIAGTSFGLVRASRKTAEAVEQRTVADKKTKEAESEKNRANVESKRARDSDTSSKFQLANARWNANRAAEARELLHQIPVDYRNNFEWHFFNRHFLGSDLTLYGHTFWALSVAFSPDGTQIASGSQDYSIKVWDAKTGEEIRTLKGPDGHKGGVASVAFSPDGSRIASGSSDKTIKVWNLKTGKVINTLDEHTETVVSVAFSPDGKRIASASRDKTIKIWDPETGEIATFNGHTAAVWCVAFSPDGQQIASASLDYSIKVWDSNTGEEIASHNLHGYLYPLTVTFSPDGKRIASGGTYNTVKVWDAKTGKEIVTLLGHASVITSVVFSPDASRIASASLDHTIKIWDANTGQEIDTLIGHADSVYSVAFSPDASRIVSGSMDKTVKVWNVKTGQETPTFSRHTDEVSSVAISLDGSRIASANNDKTIKVWDAKTGREIATLEGHFSAVVSVNFSPDGTRIASASKDKTTRVWDLKTGEATTFSGHTNQVWSVAFSPNGKRVASASWDKTIKVWDANTGQELDTFEGHDSQVVSVVFSPDGTQIASGSWDNTVKVWDANTGREIDTLRGHADAVLSVAFNADGTRIASGSRDKTIKVWETSTGRKISSLKGHTGWVLSVAFNPDGTRIASASVDQKIKLWDAATGREIATLKGHADEVRSLVFSSDGTRIVSGSMDKTIKTWDSKTDLEISSVFNGHTDVVSSVSFSPDYSQIASASMDKTIKVWDAKTGREIATLMGHSDNVWSVAFSPDGSRIYSNNSSNEKIVWNVAEQKPIEGADWNSTKVQRRTSFDGRWLVTFDGANVLLVDREYKNTPREKAFREAKAQIDPVWHYEQARLAQSSEDWFAATFHYAWTVRARPRNEEYREGFRNVFSSLKNEYEELAENLDAILPQIVKEMQDLSENR